MSEGDVAGEFFYNVRTSMVEHGRLSPWEHLLGPYETREAAEKALEIAQARTADWDEEDLEWDDDSVDEEETH